MFEDRRPNTESWELISQDRAKCLKCGYKIKMNQAKKMAKHDLEVHGDESGVSIYNNFVGSTGKMRQSIQKVGCDYRLRADEGRPHI